jgi:hypothetical protein
MIYQSNCQNNNNKIQDCEMIISSPQWKGIPQFPSSFFFGITRINFDLSPHPQSSIINHQSSNPNPITYHLPPTTYHIIFIQSLSIKKNNNIVKKFILKQHTSDKLLCWHKYEI